MFFGQVADPWLKWNLPEIGCLSLTWVIIVVKLPPSDHVKCNDDQGSKKRKQNSVICSISFL